MTKRILCVGECMLELAPAAQDGQFQMSYAGDTFNTAWYLRRKLPDALVDYFTAVGPDAASDRMIEFVKSHGIGTDSIARVADRTVGLYMIELQNGERSFSYWRSHSAAKCLADDAGVLAASFKGRDIIYLSGITLAILDADGRDTLCAALQTARETGAQIVFDPNLRPKLWENQSTMCREIMKAAAIGDVILPSHEDEADHFGDVSPQATLERYRTAGAGTVVVKDGAGTVLYAQGAQEGRVEVKACANVIDTTAAGDSFNAGFIAGLQGGDIEAAIKMGCALAAKVIGGRGALVEV